jgi:hypothetical protein
MASNVCLDYSDSVGYTYLSGDFWISFSDKSNLSHTCTISNSYSVLIGISNEELESWKFAFDSDPHFWRILTKTEDRKSVMVSQYQLRENGLIYLVDWNGNFRLCVLESKCIPILDEIHKSLMELALGKYIRTYD